MICPHLFPDVLQSLDIKHLLCKIHSLEKYLLIGKIHPHTVFVFFRFEIVSPIKPPVVPNEPIFQEPPPEKSPHTLSFSQFPTIVSSQTVSSRSHTLSQSQDRPKRTDWSIYNKKWIENRHVKSSPLPKPTQSIPLSQMMPFAPKRTIPIESSSNWKMKLDEKTKEIPDDRIVQGAYSLRLKDCVLGREQLIQTGYSRALVEFYNQSFIALDQFDYASVVEISTQDAIHRILLFFHSMSRGE